MEKAAAISRHGNYPVSDNFLINSKEMLSMSMGLGLERKWGKDKKSGRSSVRIKAWNYKSICNRVKPYYISTKFWVERDDTSSFDSNLKNCHLIKNFYSECASHTTKKQFKKVWVSYITIVRWKVFYKFWQRLSRGQQRLWFNHRSFGREVFSTFLHFFALSMN